MAHDAAVTALAFDFKGKKLATYCRTLNALRIFQVGKERSDERKKAMEMHRLETRKGHVNVQSESGRKEGHVNAPSRERKGHVNASSRAEKTAIILYKVEVKERPWKCTAKGYVNVQCKTGRKAV